MNSLHHRENEAAVVEAGSLVSVFKVTHQIFLPLKLNIAALVPWFVSKLRHIKPVRDVFKDQLLLRAQS